MDNGNKLIAGTGGKANQLKTSLLAHIRGALHKTVSLTTHPTLEPRSVLEMMGPTGRDMPGELEKAIVESTALLKFKADFSAAGAGQWLWLVLVLKDTDGSLKVTKQKMVWSHYVSVKQHCWVVMFGTSCYIDFRNKRPAYLTALDNWELEAWQAVYNPSALYDD